MKLNEVEQGLVKYLISGITNEGGWGNEPGEFKETNPLNTAEILNGLLAVRHHMLVNGFPENYDKVISQGIDYLINTQLESGGWATGSTYRAKERISKGNIVSSVWAIWAMYEYCKRCSVSEETVIEIQKVLRKSIDYLSSKVNGLFPYNPDLKEAQLMSTAYGLFGVALLLKFEELSPYLDRSEVVKITSSIIETTSIVEGNFMNKDGILSMNVPINTMICVQLFLSITYLTEIQALSILDNRLNTMKDTLWESIEQSPIDIISQCIIEEQKVIEPKKIRDFIHYTPMWVSLSALRSNKGINYTYFKELYQIVLDNIDPNYNGASYGGSKRHTWTTALTLILIGEVIDKIDLVDILTHSSNNEKKIKHIEEKSAVKSIDSRTVCVVHGRNELARGAMFDYLRAIDLNPLDWDEAMKQTNSGSPYIGEIIDNAFKIAQTIIVLITGDDEVRLLPKYHQMGEEQYEVDLTPQARPNVIFEAGLALGRYSNRTILVRIGKSKPFSDIGGRQIIQFTGSAKDRQSLANRLETTGCAVNRKGNDWLRAGNFKNSI